jgi:putative SOS response-associated peptidase YedK
VPIGVGTPRRFTPASAFFEFTGKKYPKVKHRFTLNGAPFLTIAGIYRNGKPGAPPAFTMLCLDAIVLALRSFHFGRCLECLETEARRLAMNVDSANRREIVKEVASLRRAGESQSYRN